MQLEERRVGDYIVRELTLGAVLDIRDQFPEGGKAMTLAMLGASVINGTGAPIGVEGARQIPARMAGKLSAIVAELAGDTTTEDGQKNG